MSDVHGFYSVLFIIGTMPFEKLEYNTKTKIVFMLGVTKNAFGLLRERRVFIFH